MTGSFNTSGHRTLYDFICFLEDAINSPGDESQASVSETGNSVKIMTLHQAKGLEYKVVFLYACHDYTQRDTVKTKSVSVNKELGVLTTVPLNNNYFEDYKAAPVVNLHNYVIKKKNIAEIKRLFYVGITRARNYLFISGQDRNFKYNQESFFKFLFEGLEIDTYVEMKSIESELEFLRCENEKYYNETKLLNIEIPITKEVKEELPFVTGNDLDDLTNKSFKIQQIDEIEEGEIISAARFALYNRCSLKYKLTYELGFLKLFKNINIVTQSNASGDSEVITNLDFNQREEVEIYNINDIKSRILHHILERELSTEQINNEIDIIIKKELELKALDIDTKNIKDEITGTYNVFCNSPVYKEIKSYSNYKNGFEIFCKEGDYFLHGIINKIIFSGNKIVIVNYKTDNISIDEVEKRAEEYDNQLKFYGLMVNKLFKEKKIIENWLVFINNPVIIKNKINQEDIEFIRNKIKDTVYNIRNRNFKKNLQHCRICYYYKNNKCIV
jgi:ATP-dependent helicase/nuclease subunit A